MRFRNETFYGVVDGTLGSVTGMLDIDPDATRLNSLRISVAADELSTGSLLEDRVLRSAAMLDTGAYPTMVFQAGPVAAAARVGSSITGDLSLRDARGKLTVAVTEVEHVADDLRVRATGGFSRSAFGITAFEGLSQDRVDLEIDLRLRRAGP